MARIIYLQGRVICPLAGVGVRGANASNRLVVDDPGTQVTVTDGRIELRDTRACETKTVIADLVWLATAGTTPFTIHLEVTKTGRAWAIDLHTHEPPNMTRETLTYEPFEIVANGEVLVDRNALAKAVTKVPLSRRLGAALTTTRDHLAGVTQDPAAVGYRVVDRSIGIGALGRGLLLVRVRVTSLTADNAPLIASGSLAAMLRDGTWELSIEALTERVLPELTRRDLVLFELADIPLLAEVRARGLRVGQTLGFRGIAGAGELRLDHQTTPLPNAIDVARAYLEFHMLGGMIASAVRGA